MPEYKLFYPPEPIFEDFICGGINTLTPPVSKASQPRQRKQQQQQQQTIEVI